MAALAFEDYSIADELSRKTFDALNFLVLGVQHGRLTEDQFSTGVDALFMVTSGLVDESFTKLISEAQKLCPKGKSEVRRIFFKEEAGEMKHVRASWIPGEDVIVVARLIGGTAYKGSKSEYDTAKQAQEALGMLGSKLEAKGWVEL